MLIFMFGLSTAWQLLDVCIKGADSHHSVVKICIDALFCFDSSFNWGVKMSAFFSTLSCCWFWLLLGFLLGWLLNRWLCKCCCNSTHLKTETTPVPSPASTPSKLVESPAQVATQKPAPAKATTLIDIAAAKAAGFALKNANDLTIVEGIGPKINELFHNNGVKTFADLANSTLPQMRAILDAGGSRFRIANPSTWAQQAALAAENKWAELKKLQDKLSGGVKK